MKFACERCRTRYSISDEKVRRKVLKIRCKTCGNIMVVREEVPGTAVTGGNTGIAASPSAAAKQAPQAPQAPAAAAPKQVEWYVAIKGQQFGPMKEDDVVDLFLKGKVHDRSYCWNEGLAGWTRLNALPEFAKLLNKPGAPPPIPKMPPPPPEESGMIHQAQATPAQPAAAATPQPTQPAENQYQETAKAVEEQAPTREAHGSADNLDQVAAALESAPNLEPQAAGYQDPFAAVVAQSGNEDQAGADPSSPAAPRESTRVFIMNAGLHNRSRKHRNYAMGVGLVCVLIGTLGYLDYQGIVKIPLLNAVVTVATEKAGIERPSKNYKVYADDGDVDAKLPCTLRGDCPEEKKKVKQRRKAKDPLADMKGIGDLDLDGSFNTSGAAGGGIRRSGAADLGELDPLSSNAIDSAKLRNMFTEKGKSRIDAKDRKVGISERNIVTTDGQSLSGEQISQVVQQRIGSIQNCITKSIKSGSSIEGKHYIVLTIESRGRVKRARIKDRVVHLSPLGECIGKATRKWRFPPFAGEDLDIEIPVVLGGP
jgi:predicted Zn finger-like uncharacterized protein